jgi:hypothetical protein
MSAFQVGPEHLNYLVNAAILYDVHAATIYTPEQLGIMLARENAISLNARYPQHRTEPIPYAFTIVPKRTITPVQTIKAAQCFEYQACEHHGWKESTTKRIIDALTSAAIGKLPGYQEAAWEIEAA